MILAALGTVLLVLLGFVATAVDVANGYVVRGILQHAVDDAARTAQRWSAQVDDPGADAGAVEAQAIAAAVDTVHRDVDAHGLSAVTVVHTGIAGSRLRIAARATIPTWFLRIFGITTWLPSASSDVVLWTALPPAAAFPFPTPPRATGPAPVFPTSTGPLPGVTLPEGPGSAGTGALGDATPGPAPRDGSGVVGGSSGPTGGDIAEGQ
jgi:hypothetical protein